MIIDPGGKDLGMKGEEKGAYIFVCTDRGFGRWFSLIFERKSFVRILLFGSMYDNPNVNSIPPPSPSRGDEKKSLSSRVLSPNLANLSPPSTQFRTPHTILSFLAVSICIHILSNQTLTNVFIFIFIFFHAPEFEEWGENTGVKRVES